MRTIILLSLYGAAAGLLLGLAAVYCELVMSGAVTGVAPLLAMTTSILLAVLMRAADWMRRR